MSSWHGATSSRGKHFRQGAFRASLEKRQQLTAGAHPGLLLGVCRDYVGSTPRYRVWSRARRWSDSSVATPLFTVTSRTMSWLKPTLPTMTALLTPLLLKISVTLPGDTPLNVKLPSLPTTVEMPGGAMPTRGAVRLPVWPLRSGFNPVTRPEMMLVPDKLPMGGPERLPVNLGAVGLVGVRVSLSSQAMEAMRHRTIASSLRCS